MSNVKFWTLDNLWFYFRGAEELVSSHGIPQDLLDRILIIKTKMYDKDACLEILKIRAQLENVKANPEALAELASIADGTTLRFVSVPHGMGIWQFLRYALQLLTPASKIAKICGKDTIENVHVQEAKDLFLNAKRSAQILADDKDKYMLWGIW